MPFWGGTPEKFQQFSTLGPEQQGLYNQLLQAGQGYGGGGAFGQASDYYRDLLSNNSQDYNAFAAPEMRKFQQEIVPGIAEQFAGMGSGGLSSSGFRNAANMAGTDLSERLAKIRSNLRQNAAQGLQGIGQMGLGQYNQNVYRPAVQGFGGADLGGLVGTVGGAFFGGAGAAAGGALGRGLGGAFDKYFSKGSEEEAPASGITNGAISRGPTTQGLFNQWMQGNY